MKNTLLLFALLLSATLQAQLPHILTQREQAEVKDQMLQARFEHVLPQLMREEGIDMWVIIAREYNEDAILKTFLPSTWLSARRTTMLIVYDNGKTLEGLSVARYAAGDLFKSAWNPDRQPDQWRQLKILIEERNPKKIAINKAEHFGHADGLSAYHYEQMMQVLDKKFADRVVSAENLCVRWLETRTPEEMVLYEQAMRITHAIIEEAFSEKVIQPGITTTEDVVWWFRQRAADLGLVTWFHPSVDVQRPTGNSQATFAQRPGVSVIQPGDLLHCDFGITYLGLNTDCQENAYILRPGETDAPDFLKAAHRQALRLMDILTGEFRTGRTGNAILADALAKAKAEDIYPSIYTHPIGMHGHAAGPTIGLWDRQEGVPFTGDCKLNPNTAYSIELNSRHYLDDWAFLMKMEENAFFDGKTVRYIDGRQKELFLIPRPVGHLKQ
ncbi:MAG TPA: M24 family metallopeptidase [Saprospiraceae bacterium]|nr:M24 family metallopeptidase [Saprospiraceae bacterium]HMP25746.1 M24 family metallopeptidase [Saprospiraceae bacterium]